MQATALPTSQVEGFVERVDLVNRELTVGAGGDCSQLAKLKSKLLRN